MKKSILIVFCAVLVLVGLLSAWLLLRNGNPYNKIFSSMGVSDVEKLSIFSNPRPLREAELDRAELEQLVEILNSLELSASPVDEPGSNSMTGAKPEIYAIRICLKDGADLVLMPMNYTVRPRKNEAFYVIYPNGERYGYPADGESAPKAFPAEDDAVFQKLLTLCRTLHDKYFP